jgi:hypothetical protein
MAFFRKTEEQQPSVPQDLLDLREAVEKAQLPVNVDAVAMKELERLEKTDPSSAEYLIGLNIVICWKLSNPFFCPEFYFWVTRWRVRLASTPFDTPVPRRSKVRNTWPLLQLGGVEGFL